MIAYFPDVYPDELFYSTVARYFSHVYPSYILTIEELCKSKSSRIDMEFGLWSLNSDTREFLEKTYGLKNILLNHTMFPQYARFETVERREKAEEIMLAGEGDIYSALRFPKHKNGGRFLRYCPLCFEEDKQKFGEAYWHRAHQIRDINVCSKHGCYLHNTNIEINAKASPRLWVADDIVACSEVDYASDKEKQFADYVVRLLMTPMPTEQPLLSDWLISLLEGTEYITTRGKRKFVSKLHQDMQEYYEKFSCTGIEQQHRVVKLFTGNNNNFIDICKLAFFLKIPIEEIVNPKVPEKSQTERFNKQVEQLYQEGLGCHRIARQVDSSPTTALRANRKPKKAQRNYANRKGTKKQDWEVMDKENLSEVKQMCEKIYTGNGERPKRVTVFAVTRAMEWPDKRLDYLPKCKKVIQEYSMETIEEYWARECVWAYEILKRKYVNITWKQIRNLINIKRVDFDRCKKYISNHTDKVTADNIRSLI